MKITTGFGVFFYVSGLFIAICGHLTGAATLGSAGFPALISGLVLMSFGLVNILTDVTGNTSWLSK